MKHETFPPASGHLDVPDAALLGTFADGTPLTIDIAGLSAPHTFVTGGTGAGKSSTVGTFAELSNAQGVPVLILDPEGQFGPLRQSCPGTILIGGEDGDVPLLVETIGKVVLEAFRNRASVVIRLDELSRGDQRRVVADVMNTFMDLPKQYWAHYLAVIDEVHLFAPQQGRCESSLPIAEAAARGRRRGLKLVLATQRFARVAKDAVSQCNNMLVGRISVSADIGPAADALGLTSQESMRLPKLPRGSFIARGPDISEEPVEVRIRKPRTVLEGTIETGGEAVEPVLTGEALLAMLLAASAGEPDEIADGTGKGRFPVPAGQEAPGKAAIRDADRSEDTSTSVLALLASAPKGGLPSAALALLLRGSATRTAIDAALVDLRRRKLIAGRKTLAITAVGSQALGKTVPSSRILAERIGAIRLALPKDALRVLDALAAAGQALALSEIARRTGSAERSRKLRKLLARLARAGLVRKQRHLFAVSHGYAALAGL